MRCCDLYVGIVGGSGCDFCGIAVSVSLRPLDYEGLVRNIEKRKTNREKLERKEHIRGGSNTRVGDTQNTQKHTNTHS